MNKVFRFTRIFGDHIHTLADIQGHISQDEMIVVYQLDPQAIDRAKIAQAGPLNEAKLVFPEYIKEGILVAPCEVITLQKDDGETDPKKMQIDFLPPRFVCVDLKWKLNFVHIHVMQTFCHALENK